MAPHLHHLLPIFWSQKPWRMFCYFSRSVKLSQWHVVLCSKTTQQYRNYEYPTFLSFMLCLLEITFASWTPCWSAPVLSWRSHVILTSDSLSVWLPLRMCAPSIIWWFYSTFLGQDCTTVVFPKQSSKLKQVYPFFQTSFSGQILSPYLKAVYQLGSGNS